MKTVTLLILSVASLAVLNSCVCQPDPVPGLRPAPKFEEPALQPQEIPVNTGKK